MKEKIKISFTKADAIIVKYLGTSAEDYYGEKFKAIDEYVRQMDSDNYDDVDEKLINDFTARTAPKLKPIIDEMIENNRNSKNAFRKLKELVTKNNPNDLATSISTVIESIENGVQDIFKSSKSSVIETWQKTINLISSSEGLIPLPAGATRGNYRGKNENTLQFVFSAEKDYEGEIIHEDDSIRIIIECSDLKKEFFLTGHGFAQTGIQIDGKIEFKVPDKGDYILSESGVYFRALSLK